MPSRFSRPATFPLTVVRGIANSLAAALKLPAWTTFTNTSIPSRLFILQLYDYPYSISRIAYLFVGPLFPHISLTSGDDSLFNQPTSQSTGAQRTPYCGFHFLLSPCSQGPACPQRKPRARPTP